MRALFVFLCLLLCTRHLYALEDSTTVWINTGPGKIYKMNINDCSPHLYCSTGKEFMDIALTPNGNLWGNASDTLYQIYVNGYIRPIGRIPFSTALTALNDTTLLINSETNLLAVKTTNATTTMIGNIGYRADGDLAWMGRDLYMVGQLFLVKITLDDNYSSVQQLDSISLGSASEASFTPGLATAYKHGFGYCLIGFPQNVEIYRIDTTNGHYHEICNHPQTITVNGASSMIFPPGHYTSAIDENSLSALTVNIYPNPAKADVYIEIKNSVLQKSAIAISLFDLTGRLIEHQTTKSTFNKVDISNIPSGLYILEIRPRDKQAYRQKIIKS